MRITLVNPDEKDCVWAGISESMAYGVYCFPPLGLVYLQASLVKHSQYRCEIFDGVVDDLVIQYLIANSSNTVLMWLVLAATLIPSPMYRRLSMKSGD